MRRDASSSSVGIESISVRSFAAASSTKIDRLIGQEPVGDVAVREHRRGDERRILDPHAVMDFVAFAQARAGSKSCLRPSAGRP